MLLEKVIDATIDVRNPVNFCADKDRHLMTEIRNIYVGRCFKGAYIVGVREILRTSACRIESTNSSGEAHIDVQFLAEVVVFSQWDILVGAEIVRNQQMVVCTYGAPGAGGRAVVTVLASKAVEALAVGQKIVVRVVMAQHQPMQPQAAVVGALLVCDKAAPVYRLRAGALDAAARAELAPMVQAIDAELGRRAALAGARKADLWFFELLLYAYRGAAGAADQAVPAGGAAPDWAGPGALADPGGEPRNLLEIARRVVAGEAVPVAGYWCRPLALYRSSPLAAWAEAPPKGWQQATDSTPRAVFAEFLKNVLDFLTATREMAELYNTRELVEAHRGLWAIMRAQQTPQP
jgi:hypothetical protein